MNTILTWIRSTWNWIYNEYLASDDNGVWVVAGPSVMFTVIRKNGSEDYVSRMPLLRTVMPTGKVTPSNPPITIQSCVTIFGLTSIQKWTPLLEPGDKVRIWGKSIQDGANKKRSILVPRRMVIVSKGIKSRHRSIVVYKKYNPKTAKADCYEIAKQEVGSDEHGKLYAYQPK